MKKKNQRIGMVTIEDDHITAFDTEGVEVKLTRHQRNAFLKYKSGRFTDIIMNEFQVTDIKYILADGFFIKRDGIVVKTIE